MSGPLVETPQGLLGPQRVQRLRRLAALRLAFLARRHRLRHQQAGQRGLERVALGRGSGRGRPRARVQRPVVRLLRDLGEHELVPVPRDGADVGRLARLVTQRAPQASHGLGERAV